MKRFNEFPGAGSGISFVETPSRAGGRPTSFSVLLGCLLVFSAGASSLAAPLPGDWPKDQPFIVPAPGLVKLSLPVETLDTARPALEDLRLYDAAGNELPFYIEHPAPASKVTQNADSFQVSLNTSTTVILMETGLAQPLEAITLESPANRFIKAVKVEGATDGRKWQTLAQGQPIFRQPNDASQLRVTFPAGTWRSLRLTVDDQRTQPIPFTGARVHAAAAETAPSEKLAVTIAERHENPGETRLTLNLGAANLDLATVQIETAEPLFTRQVTLAVSQISEDAIREHTIGQGTIYRVAIEGQPAVANLSVPVEAQVRARELLLLIHNQDSPPLSVTAVHVTRRPVYLVFMAKNAGVYHLLTGNGRCPAPRYDLASLGVNLKAAAVSAIQLPPPADNPNYRPSEVLPNIEAEGTTLDVAEWKYRKALKFTRTGAQQLELDLDVLAHALPGFQDLRLMRDGRQVPYILERTSISRWLKPTVTATNDSKDKKLSRWIINLPQRNLPITRLSCTSSTTLFQRDVALYEELADDRGEKYRRPLSSAAWVQTPDGKNREFVLTFDSPLQSATLFLETHNSDNPPIELEQFKVFHLATRLLFKAKADDAISVYYGNPRVSSPRYDLSLVAGQLLAAEKSAVTLLAEEQLKKSSWAEGRTPGKGGVVFWGILAVVVVGLLFVISRLLPKASPPTDR